MSFLARTPIHPASLSTDLSKAFESHEVAYRGDKTYSLREYDREWLNVLRNRGLTQADATLSSLTDDLLGLLQNPQSVPSFKDAFKALYNSAMGRAYPLAGRLLAEKAALAGVSMDYTLECIDLGLVRVFEDATVADSTMRDFVAVMLRILSADMSKLRTNVLSNLFDAYSEAAVYHLLKERAGGRLDIGKIKEKDTPTPDFKCTLRTEFNGEMRALEFYIEVKSLDIVHAPQRLLEMREAALDAQIEIDAQRQAGRNIAMTEHEIAPYRRYGADDGYDPRSVQGVIETLMEKAANNFKASQFRLGPTFALANMFRLPLPGQGASALSPFFYDRLNGGACVSGVLWHVVFGELGAPVHRSPDFEGAGTFDGNLQRAGLLVNSSLTPLAAGVITLYHDQGAYRFNGLYDTRWKDDHGWTNVETEIVFNLLCGDYNSKDNSMAHQYALRRA